MINRELIAPESIVIIGGSNNTQKPGGKIIRNLLEGKFPGKLYAVNPKETEVQGIPCFPDITSLPNTELAISRSGSSLPLYCRRAGFDPQYQSIYYYIGRIRRRNS